MVTEKELNALRSIIENCREKILAVKVKEEISIEYIFTRLYCKTILTMCEIYTLLNAGYPEGAMALARNTYETMVIMTYLYVRREDQELIERFYDDFEVRTCSDDIKFLEWLISNGKDDAYTRIRLQELKKEYEEYIEKYPDFVSRNIDSVYFKQYWWAGRDKSGRNKSFHHLREETNNKDNYYYDISCYRVHAGMAGMLTFDNSEEGVLIGACDGGKEDPVKFSLLNFTVSTRYYFDIMGIDCSAVFSKMKNLQKTIRIK
jgi:hypothetical protein